MTTATTNGHGSHQTARERLRSPAEDEAGERSGSMLGSVLGAVKGLVASRIPPADLDERDPDYIRESLPRLWLLSSLYFRGDVRGLGNVPRKAACCWSATTRAAT